MLGNPKPVSASPPRTHNKENAESKPTSNRPGDLKGMQMGELTDRKEVLNAVICRTRQILFAGRGIGGVQAGRCKPK